MAVIANAGNGGYARARVQRPKAVVMEEYEDDLAAKQAELERQVRAGKWLRPGSVAILLGVGRTKAHMLLTEKTIRFKRIPGSKHRLANPEDVLKLLEESRQLEGDSVDPPSDEQP